MRLAPEWEEAHHLYGRALELASWSKDWDELVDGARADQAWLETLRWAELAGERRPALWRSGRAMAEVEALTGLGRAAEAEALRAEAERRAAPAFHVRFGHDLELVRVEVPADIPRGSTGHRAVRVAGSPPGGRELHGPRPRRPARRTRGLRAGSSDGRRLRHRQGETVEETVELRVPADAPPGPYQIRAAVWDPARAKHLPVAASDRPHQHRTVTVADLTVR